MSQFYVGVKIVFAWPEEYAGKPGYVVRYPDGYQSWSPKEVFEDAYLPMGESNDNLVTNVMVDRMIGRYKGTNLEDGRSTLVKAESPTGFMLYEISSCVDPKNYDSQLGAEICLKRIESKVWQFLGFVVRWGKFGLKYSEKNKEATNG